MNLMNDLPNNINRVRTIIGEKQAEFGKRFNRTYSTVFGWENGKMTPKDKEVYDFLYEILTNKKLVNAYENYKKEVKKATGKILD